MHQGSQRKLSTLPAIAKKLGIGRYTLRRAAEEGRFAVYDLDGAWPRADEAEVDAWIRSTRINPERDPSSKASGAVGAP